MTTIHLSDDVGLRVAKNAKAAGYRKVDDYVRDVLLAQSAGTVSAKLEKELLKGLDSPLVPMTDQMWRDLSDRVHKRRKARGSR